MHFGDGIYEQYLGTETVRGIPCNKWQSCQYWPEMDATSTVIWYFTGELGGGGGGWRGGERYEREGREGEICEGNPLQQVAVLSVLA